MLQIKDHPTKATVYRAGDTWIRQYKSMHDLIHDAGKIDSSVASGTFERGCDWTWGGGHDDVPGTLRKMATGCLPTQTSTSSSKHSATSRRRQGHGHRQSRGKRRRLTSAWAAHQDVRIFTTTQAIRTQDTQATAPTLRVGFRSNGNGTLTQRDWRTRRHWQQFDPLLVPQRLQCRVVIGGCLRFSSKWDICATTVVPSGTKPSTPRILACSTPVTAVWLRLSGGGHRSKFGSADEI